MRRVKKACVSSSAIPSWWSTQPSRVTLRLKVNSPMRRVYVADRKPRRDVRVRDYAAGMRTNALLLAVSAALLPLLSGCPSPAEKDASKTNETNASLAFDG